MEPLVRSPRRRDGMRRYLIGANWDAVDALERELVLHVLAGRDQRRAVGKLRDRRRFRGRRRIAVLSAAAGGNDEKSA